ncbi:hypothetical protein K2Z83_20390 [Oscillochloris sp. ZM17-4]|uniref:hypothetical protein n=1 Tax=Oscillochloris sp. ZM17-4 TaxID=2866714 RepID=UPI001C72B785|nr:hypothetical protein [Oscillochloris sp. ZM17-4]MBX0330031.1 hypothetical protein [Oscillochloris sp. ZM17-4]
MRPTTVQLFYKKSIRLAPYNQAEVGLILTLEADPDAPIAPAAIGDALQPTWAQVQAFVHGQEDAAINRFLELNPQEQLPRRNGRAVFTPVAAEVIGEADEPLALNEGFPARQEPAGDAAPAAKSLAPDEGFPARQETPAAGSKTPPRTVEEAERRYFARYATPLGGTDMDAIRAFFSDSELSPPASVDEWLALATRTRAEVKARKDAAEHEQKVAAAKSTLADAEAAAVPLARPARSRRSPAPPAGD